MALSVKAFDPEGSNAFTLRAFFLPSTAINGVCAAVPGRLVLLGARTMMQSRHIMLSFVHTP